ncbi:MAG: hypothetical protein ACMG51_09405 [Ginsengibacter sp.]
MMEIGCLAEPPTQIWRGFKQEAVASALAPLWIDPLATRIDRDADERRVKLQCFLVLVPLPWGLVPGIIDLLVRGFFGWAPIPHVEVLPQAPRTRDEDGAKAVR